MRKLITSIINIVLLLVTSLVLVLSLFAWYVSNREVSASGISARVKDPELIVDEVKIYSFESKDNLTYVVSQIISSKDATPGTAQMTYSKGLINSNAISLKLMEVTFKDDVNLTNFIADSWATKFIGFDNNTNPGWISNASNLSLSSVIQFKTFTTGVTIPANITQKTGDTVTDNNKITFGSSELITDNYDTFTYNNEFGENGDIINKYVQLTDTLTGIDKLYVLLDFNDVSFDKIFNNQIGNPEMETATEFTFDVDFRFIVIGRLVTE